MWYLARSLEVLRQQVNELVPNRGKANDGSIGDEAHAARTSDHNPWVHNHAGVPVVTAIDITHDPAHGFDSYKFADMLMEKKDPRIKYVISNHRIGSGSGQTSPAWTWRPYNGANAHDHHVHISVKSDETFFDNPAKWDITVSKPSPKTITDEDKVASDLAQMPVLKFGDSGANVKRLQEALKDHGETVTIDSAFGSQTRLAVLHFQQVNGLEADGVVGGYTWKKLIA